MIQVYRLTVTDSTGKDTLFTQSFENIHMANELIVEAWRKDRKAKYSNMLDQDVLVDIHYRMRPPNDVNPMDIATESCLQLGIKMKDILGPKRDRPIVDARVMINQIVLDASFTPSEIEKHLWDNRIYAHYRKQFISHYETNKKFKSKYDMLKDNVMMKLFK